MNAKVFLNIAILILISEATPQDYGNVPPDIDNAAPRDSSDPNNGGAGGNEYPDPNSGAAGGNEYPDPNNGGAGGNEYSDVNNGGASGNEYPDPNNGAANGKDYPGPGGNDYPGAGGNDYPAPGGYDYPAPGGNDYPGPGGNDYPGPGGNYYPAGAGYDYPASGEYDDAEYDYRDNSQYNYLLTDKSDYYGESGYESEYSHPVPLTQLKLPTSSEILDRNKPEPGFDLTNEEIKKLKMWPDAVVPYYIDVYSFSDKVMRDTIRSFLSSVNSLTALNFVELPSPPTDNSRWVFFINRRGLLGCADHSIRNFTNVGVQQVVLGYHCMSTEGELAEAVLSIAGVPAQHNAPNRDYYIRIKEENIIPEKKFLFEKRSDDEWLFHDLEYDFQSAGHFHSFKHSINGRATIVPQKKSADLTLGESKTLTTSDILKIRMLYNYLAKKKLLKAPDCHKLFEPGKKFAMYKSTDANLKPRPKPYRFTGEAPDASLDNEADNSAEKVSDNEDMGEFTVIVPDEPINNDMDNTEVTEGLNDYNNEYSPIVTEAPVDEDYDYNYGNNDDNTVPTNDYEYPDNAEYDIPIPNPPQEEDESQNYSPGDFHGKKPTIISIGQPNINNQVNLVGLQTPDPLILSLKSPQKKKKKPFKEDLLGILSDYKTDEDGNTQDLMSYQAKNPKLDLKFKPVG